MIQVDDLSRSLIAFEQISTLVIVVELSQSSWLAAGVVPGIERRPLKKLDPDPTALLHLVEGWRDRATKAGRTVTRTVLAFESGRDGFWLARWLRVRGVETFVMHSTSVAVSREPRRAKTDRLDTEMLIRVFLGWLRGEPRHCKMVSYRPELTLTRQKGCVGAGSRVADVVVGVWGTTMCALAIRDDISPEELRLQARRERDGRVSARLIAIANALEGMDRASAARLTGMDRQTLRDWVHRYNAEGIAGLCNRPAPGRRPKLTEGQMAALKAVVLAGPDPAVDKIARWRIVDLCRWVERRWGVSYSDTGMLRLLWSLDLSHRKTRPRHPQSNEAAQKAFKKGGLLLA